MKNKKLTGIVYAVVFVALGLFLMLIMGTRVSASTKTVTVGQGIKVFSDDATKIKASDNKAYVTKDGTVVAKKTGKVTITAVVDGKKKQKELKLVSEKQYRKNAFDVAADEIAVAASPIIYTNAVSAGAFEFKATVAIKNNGSKKVDKVTLKAKIGDETVEFIAKDISAGKEKNITVAGLAMTNEKNLVLDEISVASGKYIHSYSYTTGKRKLDYAHPDKKAPVIKGFVGKNCHNGEAVYMTLFSDDKNYDFFKYVWAVDGRDTKVDLTVDTSRIDYTKSGTYKIVYTATDSSGNKSKATSKIAYRVVGDVEAVADDLLKRLIKPNWSDKKKLEAIYDYVRGHISYTGHSDKSSWEKESIHAALYGYGDCYSYYALSRALLTRAGFPSIKVKRVAGYGRHWWNMVYVDGAFYHYDACPRASGGRFFLLTDSQLTEYSNSHGYSHIWDYQGKPKSGTKILAHV